MTSVEAMIDIAELLVRPEHISTPESLDSSFYIAGFPSSANTVRHKMGNTEALIICYSTFACNPHLLS